MLYIATHIACSIPLLSSGSPSRQIASWQSCHCASAVSLPSPRPELQTQFGPPVDSLLTHHEWLRNLRGDTALQFNSATPSTPSYETATPPVMPSPHRNRNNATVALHTSARSTPPEPGVRVVALDSRRGVGPSALRRDQSTTLAASVLQPAQYLPMGRTGATD